MTVNTQPVDLRALPPDYLLTPDAAAAILETTPGTLAVWRCTRRYPLPWTKIGRKVRYRAGDLLAFIGGQVRGA